MTRRLVIQRLDLIAAIIGAALGVIVILFSYIWGLGQQDIGIVVLLACIIYILLRKKLLSASQQSPSHSHRKILLLTNIIFLLTFSASILLLNLNLYYRPPLYFILVSVAAASIAVEILYSSEKSRSTWLILFKVIVLSLSVGAGIFYGFPTLIGTDTWSHADFANFIAGYGHVPSRDVYDAGQYNNFPDFHILVAATQIITSASVKTSLFFSIGFITVISTVFIYLVGKSIGGVRFGLFAVLIANFCDMIIYSGINNITTGSLVLCWFMLILYLIFRKKSSVATKSIMILLFFTMVFTHQVTVFVTLIALIGLLIGKKLYDYFYQDRERQEAAILPNNASVGTTTNYPGNGSRGRNPPINISLISVLILGIGMLAWWMIVAESPGGTTFFDGAVLRLEAALTAGILADPSSSYPGLASSYSIVSNALYHPGYLILLFLGLIGIMLWLSAKIADRSRFALISSIVLLYIFVYGSPFIGSGFTFLPHRWLPFVYLLLTLGAAQAIVSLVGLIRRNWGKTVLTSLGAVLVIFFMLTTPYICADSPLYDRDRTGRSSFTSSEVAAAFSISQIYEGTVIIDAAYNKVFTFVLPEDNLTIKRLNDSNRDNLPEGMILLRTTLLTEPTLVTAGGTFGEGRLAILGPEFFENIEQIPGSNLVYSNKEVMVYYIYSN